MMKFMMKKILGLCVLGFIFSGQTLSIAQESRRAKIEAFYDAAPTVLPHVRREMKTVGFWVSRHPDVDHVILDEEGIKRLNASIRDELTLVKDLSAFPSEYEGTDFKRELDEKINELKTKNYFLQNGHKAEEDFFAAAWHNSNLENIAEKISVRYGIIVHFADQRFLPTDEALTAQKGDIDFDELQNSDLDVSLPVVVLHTSTDGQWMYTISDISSGWVRSQNVALCSREEFQKFLKPKLFALVTGAKVDLYLDPALREYYDYVRMGTRLVYSGQVHKASVEVQIPTRRENGKLKIVKGYTYGDVREEQNYLMFTPRRIYEQAFKLLNAPYGWGGANGEQDCSRFLQEVFATVGIHLPRDSKDQAKVGKLLKEFKKGIADSDKLKVLRQAEGGATVLPLKGHIMLYLGMVDNRPYAIHAFWAYRENDKRENRVRVVNRVAVSDLYLGEGSKKGSLLHRLMAVRMLSE